MKRILFVSAAMLWSGPALAQTERFALQTNLDHVWTMLAAGLVFMMQGGFLLLEAGSVRAKNSINVAQKNLLDFLLSTAVFGLVGFSFLFGDSIGGFIGWSGDLALFNTEGDWNLTFFVFQLTFCGTAATIVSGAIAERMSIGGYVMVTILIGAVIYPIAGHWSWGGLLSGSQEPFLARLGFIDFAGSTVVHSVGAWVALAAVIVLGPRHGKFDEHGKPVELHGHSPILSTFGALMIWAGWIGFNGGSTTAGTPEFAEIIANTMIAGGFGGLTAFFVGRWIKGYNRPEFIVNGTLGGLVAITAGCDAVGLQSAILIGAIGSTTAFFLREWLEHLGLDDPLGAIAVHGGAGAMGTILAGVFARPEALLATGRMEQIGVQAFAVCLYFAFAFGITFTVLKLAAFITTRPDGSSGLRVPVEDEIEGLNISEHRAPLGMTSVVRAMQTIVENPQAEVSDITLDRGEETFEVAVLFNQIMADMRSRRDAENAQNMSIQHVNDFMNQLAAVMKRYARGDFSARLQTDEVPAEFTELSEGANAMAQSLQTIMDELDETVSAMAHGDLSRRIEGPQTGVFLTLQRQLNASFSGISEVLGEVERAVAAAGKGDLTHEIKTLGRQGFLLALCEGVNSINRSTQTSLDDIKRVVSSVADGDLTQRMSADYEGVYADISSDINRMTDALVDLIGDVEASTNSVQSRATQIMQNSDLITAEARKNQELVGTLVGRLREIENKTSGNEARVLEALSVAQKAQDAAAHTQDVSRLTIERMSDADSAVTKIISALDVIEDISVQTHLLSLNASVEAARAQEAGLGFNVVASEVRKLAANSNETAEGIKRHVDDVKNKVAATAEGISLTNDALTQITEGARRTTDLVHEISEVGSAVITNIEQATKDLSIVDKRSAKSLHALTSAETAAQQLATDALEVMTKLVRFKRPAMPDKTAA